MKKKHGESKSENVSGGGGIEAVKEMKEEEWRKQKYGVVAKTVIGEKRMAKIESGIEESENRNRRQRNNESERNG
jgi:hypothetical protein